MKQGFKRVIRKLFQGHDKPAPKTTARKEKKPDRLKTDAELKKEERAKRHARIGKDKDLKHVSGQARIAARWFRKAEYRQRKALRPPLFPMKVAK